MCLLVLPGGPLPPVPICCLPLAGDALVDVTSIPADLLGSYPLTPVNSYLPTSEAIQLPHCGSALPYCGSALPLYFFPLQICCSVIGAVAVQMRDDKLAGFSVLGHTDKLGSYKPAYSEHLAVTST